MKYKAILSVLMILLMTNIGPLQANSSQLDLNIKIVGAGKVYLSQTDQSCTHNCTLKVKQNSTQKIMLTQQANNGSMFHHWAGKGCIAGEGVIISDLENPISVTNNGAKTILLEDFEGDELPDAITIELFNGNIQFARNNGKGGFTQTNTIAKDLDYPTGMDSVDWDFDGDHDLLVVVYGSESILVYLNDGKANFTLSETIKIAGLKPYAIAVEDINNDGKPDLLLASFEANIKGSLVKLVESIANTDLSWFVQNEKLKFDHYQTLSKKQGIVTLDVADIDNDGDIDIAAASITGDQAIVYWNQGKKYVADTIIRGIGAYGVALGDADNNGLVDLLVASYWDEKLELALQTKSGVFGNIQHLKSFNNGPTATSMADIDVDGRLDIASAVFGENLFFWLKNESSESCIVANNAVASNGFDNIKAVFKTIEQQHSKTVEHQNRITLFRRQAKENEFIEMKKTLVDIEPKAAKLWFNWFEAGEFQKSCEIGGANTKRSDEEKVVCQSRLEGWAETLGKRISREFIGTKFVDVYKGKPGEYAVVVYKARYDNAAKGETVFFKVLLQKVEDQWRILGVL